LTATLTETDIFANIRSMLKTAALPFALTCAVYLLAGMGLHSGGQVPDLVSLFRVEFNLSFWPVLPALVLLTLALCKVNVRLTMTAGILTALPICLWVQHTAPDTLTPGFVDYARMMGSTARGSHTTTQTTIDLIAWTDTQTAPGAWKPGEAITAQFNYTDSHGNRHTWSETVKMKATPAECTAVNPGRDARAEEVLRRDEYRQTAPKATPPELTPKECREHESLCKREAELAELWKAFEAMPQAVNPYATRA
jgi:hypothetical protein